MEYARAATVADRQEERRSEGGTGGRRPAPTVLSRTSHHRHDSTPKWRLWSGPRAKESRGATPQNRTHHPTANFFECGVPMYGNSFRMSVWGLRPVGGH